MERLQKVLAKAGFASRRGSEQLILDGKVTINGTVVRELGTKVDPTKDEIIVEGKHIRTEKPLYLLFNKPKGVITSISDPGGRKVIGDYIKDVKERVFPVGRLDYDTEGLLLLTNDGDFAFQMTHPSHQVSKTYHVTVEGVVHNEILDKLAKGVKLEDGITKPAEVEYVDVDPERKRTIFSITIKEGRNRQIRRMCEKVHLHIILLRRVKFGFLTLEGIARGTYRKMSEAEIRDMRKIAGPIPGKEETSADFVEPQQEIDRSKKTPFKKPYQKSTTGKSSRSEYKKTTYTNAKSDRSKPENTKDEHAKPSNDRKPRKDHKPKMADTNKKYKPRTR